MHTQRAQDLFREQHLSIIRHTDRLFARLMLFQWVFAIGLALFVSPRAWVGSISHVHLHVWAAIFLGGAITALPVLLAVARPGSAITRHVIAVGQMTMSALLIHLTGGRIETHFHVFGSLAILAFYRDWPVLISASIVVFVDHLLRGFFWPQSVYGVFSAPMWRSLEHAGWVLFEVVFLIISIRKSLGEMHSVVERQAKLEVLKQSIEQTVADRTAQLAQAQQIARLGSWEWDIVNDIVTWSDETYRLYGFEEKDFGSPMAVCMKRVHPDDAPLVQNALDRTLKTRVPFDCDHRAVLPDGTLRTMHGRAELICDSDGKPLKMVGTAQDVTEAKQAEEALLQSELQLRQAQKMEAVGRLAGGVAHDFNNLLTVITGYCELMLSPSKNGETNKQCTEEILKAADRAASLTKQLLAFSRKQVLQPKVLDLNAVVTGMERMARRLIGEDIELRTLLKTPLGKIKADPGQIEQVILNLVVNARDAMPRGGRVLIQTENVTLNSKSGLEERELHPGPYVLLAVTDTGVGMTPEVRLHLFEPFFTTKGHGKGTGLGLATCYGIVKQSGGDIRVYSEPNRGTTFKIYLPCVADEVSPTPSKEIRGPRGGSETILLVEDEPGLRKLAANILRNQGYFVYEAEDGFSGVQLAQGENAPRLDLIVSDVIMPRMGGKEMVDNLKLQYPDLRVLFTSGYTDDALADHGVLSPGLDFIEKPFSPHRLANKVRDVLDRPALVG